MIEMMKKLISDEEGQDLVEYALLLVFLALAAITVLPTLGRQQRFQPIRQLADLSLIRML